MNFLTVLLATALYRNWLGGNPVRDRLPDEAWFESARGLVDWTFGRYLLSVVVPVAVVLVVAWQLNDLLLGIVYLLVALLVMFYSLDVVDTDLAFDDHALWLREVSAAPESADRADLQAAQDRFRGDVAYDFFQGFMVVVFWFLVAGPAGALLYRLTQVYLARLDPSEDELFYVDKVVYWMEWVPARVAMVIFAFVGDFSRTAEVMAEDVLNMEDDAHVVLSSTIAASMDAVTADSTDAFVARATEELADFRLLLDRALWGWVGVAAVLAIFGI